MQTKTRSAIEAVTMTIIGMGYAVPLNYWMINHLKWSSQWSQAFWMTVWFTIASLVFKFSIRRFFNWLDINHPV